MGRLLTSALLLGAVAASGSCDAAQAQVQVQEVDEVVSLHVSEAPMVRPTTATIPASERPQINLDAVWWEAPRTETLGRLADRWGTREELLLELNPHLDKAERVEQGKRVLVYRFQPGTVSRSVGTPSRGRIENGAPFPEGEGWVLRSFRPRSYATRQVVKELALSLTEWREFHPEANPVKIGEFSKRGGGRVRPHKSHRSGRDVDIGYVMLQPDEGHRFVRVDGENLDAAATWGLVSRLLATGAVESIFMDKSVQLQLVPYAAQSMDEVEQRATFSVLEPDARARKKTAIKAWRGHDDHMHIRFRCTEADLNCGAAPPRKKKRRKKKRRKKKRRR